MKKRIEKKGANILKSLISLINTCKAGGSVRYCILATSRSASMKVEYFSKELIMILFVYKFLCCWLTHMHMLDFTDILIFMYIIGQLKRIKQFTSATNTAIMLKSYRIFIWSMFIDIPSTINLAMWLVLDQQ